MKFFPPVPSLVVGLPVPVGKLPKKKAEYLGVAILDTLGQIIQRTACHFLSDIQKNDYLPASLRKKDSH